MDLVSSCKDKLTYFRIKELKDVLTQLGLAKQGKKQDLMDRILAVLSDEEVSRSHGWGKKNSIQKEGVAKIIDDTYRKMQLPGATDLASKSHSGSDLNLVKPKEEIDSYQPEEKARCPCGSQSISKSMIKCEDRMCQVWQHVDCVIIPEKAMEGVPPELPAHFYCDICRINRADPFWVTIGLPLLPLKLQSSGTAADGTTVVQNADKTFMLSRADREMLQRTEYDLQVWCILLNDKVPFRMQWPQFTELQVNGVPIRTTNRPGSQLLGINGRDDCPAITTCSREGVNKICLSRRDARVFCFGIRIAKKRTFQQVMSLVPKELDGEPFEDALARVRRCTGGGGGTATENADSDSDIEVVADSITVNLRCPMSGSRMKVAGRFKPCAHMGCFDLEAFVELNQRSRKWQCPICLKNYSLENIIIDPYFNRITFLMRNCGEDVNEIDVRPDGSWRAKNEHIYRDLAQWHRPDGSLLPTDDAEVKVKPELEGLIQVKQEEASGGHASLKLGIKKNRNGVWEVNKPDNIHHPPSGFYALERLENSATGSCREGEDQSVNQDGGHYDLSNGHELDSISLNFDPAFNIEAPVPLPAPLIEADIIVLSDSDDDNVTFVSPGSIFGANTSGDAGIPYPAPHPGVTEGTIVNSCLGLFENDDDNFEMPLWPIQSAPQAGSSFELFGAADNAEASDPPIIEGFGLGSSSQARDPSTRGINNEFSENLVDNPLAFSGDDPSLQLFLPNHRSCGGPLPNDSGVRPEIPNRDRSDDWISLTLAAGGGGFSAAAPLQTNEMNSRQQSTQNEMADTASLLLSINEERSPKRPTPTQNGEGVGGPFSHPRQPRSVRRRMYLSIDTESD